MYSMPKGLTAATGMDALTHAIEPTDFDKETGNSGFWKTQYRKDRKINGNSGSRTSEKNIYDPPRKQPVEALRDVNFNVEQGEFVAIMGESGSGKTTLLNLLAALDKPTGGQIRLNGKNLGDLKEKEIAAFRRENLGFVFQDFNLLDTFSLKDNIFLPLVLEGNDTGR